LRLKNGNTEEKWVIREEFLFYNEFFGVFSIKKRFKLKIGAE